MPKAFAALRPESSPSYSAILLETSRGRGEDGPSPHAGKVEGAVEVHDPKTWGFLSWKCRLHLWRLVGEWISPFGGELR
jgi:hypothetical protein